MCARVCCSFVDLYFEPVATRSGTVSEVDILREFFESLETVDTITARAKVAMTGPRCCCCHSVFVFLFFFSLPDWRTTSKETDPLIPSSALHIH